MFGDKDARRRIGEVEVRLSGDHLDLEEIEQGVVNDVTERIEVAVTLGNNRDRT